LNSSKLDQTLFIFSKSKTIVRIIVWLVIVVLVIIVFLLKLLNLL